MGTWDASLVSFKVVERDVIAAAALTGFLATRPETGSLRCFTESEVKDFLTSL
jgi:hypothetical protein